MSALCVGAKGRIACRGRGNHWKWIVGLVLSVRGAFEGSAAVVAFGDSLFIDDALVTAIGTGGNPATGSFSSSSLATLPQFDSRLGTLTSVTIEVATTAGNDLEYFGSGGRWFKVDSFSI